MVSEEKDKTTNTLGSKVAEITISVDSGLSKMAESISNMVTSMQPTIDAIGEIAAKTLSVVYKLSELFKYHEIVPPQVYDMLVKLKVPLSTQEIEELQKLETEDEKKVYTIFTRKTKGKKIYNPKFHVNKEMFDAIKLVLSRNRSSISVENGIVYFDKDTCALDVYGLVTYMKKDSDRYRLCKYMFGNKRKPREWEVKDLVEELSDGERVYDPNDKKSSHNWINGKIVELNKDVHDSIGIDELVSYERGRFVLNSANRL